MNFFLAIILSSLLPLIAVAKKDDGPSSSLSVGEIVDFIELERTHLRGEYKVDLVKKFRRKSHVENVRFGNKKHVLNLKGLSFSGEDMRMVIFTMANMVGCSLSGADFSGADLVHVDLTGANLSETNFTRADLSNAYFENVDLSTTIFKGANLFGATFEKIKGLDEAALAKIRSRTRIYVELIREPLPGYYKEEELKSVEPMWEN